MLPQMGHNNPPTEIEILEEQLAEENDNINPKILGVLALKVPETVKDEEQAGILTGQIKTLIAISKEVEERRKSIKKPYHDCGKRVDEWGGHYQNLILKRKEEIQKPLSEFLQRKEAEERQRLLEAEERKRKEAAEAAEKARLQAEADMQEAADCEKGGLGETAQELMESAVIKNQEADMLLQKATEAAPAEITKARAQYGSGTASNKTVWVGEVENYDLIDTETLRDYFSKDAIDKAVKAYVKDGGRMLRGAKIYQTTKLNVR